MIQQFTNILPNFLIDSLLELPEIINRRNKLNSRPNGSEYFQIPISNEIKYHLHSHMGMNLDHLTSIPMRWIKGDTIPHKDTCISPFKNTYLVYLTDSDGELIIDNNSYSITKGSGYIFSESLSHKTIGTESEPRLLIGPMSEEGFSVGISAIQGQGNSTIYIRQNGSDIEYSFDLTSWSTIYWPCGVVNTDTTLGKLKIEFTTDITLTTEYNYFWNFSENIQYGSTSLKNDGSRPIITIDGINNYPGFIKNGDIYNSGYDNINIYNLKLVAINGSTLYTDGNKGGGWIGQQFFKGGSNFIINCSSDGSIAIGGGGIVGSDSPSLGDLTIIGCSSSGMIEDKAGGIIGSNAGQNTSSVICESCWSTGTIGENSGGIYGSSAGENNGNVIAINCYSLGNQISANAGGIFGNLAGTSASAIANNCYSQGMIGTDGGGIFGRSAASDGGITQANNCYTLGNNIYGSNSQSGASINNCYAANGNWSNSTANNILTGIPNPVIGTTWISTGLNEPYELRNIGYSPYALQNIIGGDSPSLNKSFTQTINVGNSTNNGIINNQSYTILQISPNETTITINSNSGVITTTSNTPVGNYSIFLRNNGSYNITEFNLTVQSESVNVNSIPCLIHNTTVLTPHGYIPVQHLNKGEYIITSDNRKVKIVNIFKSIVKGNKNTFPCIIPKGSISHNYPPNDLRISQNHLIQFENNWILPRMNFSKDSSFKEIEYYHIQLKNYSSDHLVINNGIIVESLCVSSKDIAEYFYRVKCSILLDQIKQKQKHKIRIK